MLEKTRKKMAFRYLNYKYRRRKETDITHFHNVLADANRMLICMPMKFDDLSMSKAVLSLLQFNFPKKDITLFVNSLLLGGIQQLPYPYIGIEPQQLNYFLLPNHDIVNQVKDLHVDVAIDLNPHLDISSAYVCRESGAKVRVSFFKMEGDEFFNFQIRPSPEGTPESKYDSLIRYLSAVPAN